MISIDTEATGLWFNHGCQTFAVGIYDGTDLVVHKQAINPITRRRFHEFTKEQIEDIRRRFNEADLVVMHNSIFDVKALCEIGVFDWTEPTKESFWEKIIDSTILSHLFHNTDKRSLKDLCRKYLGVPYDSDEKLGDIVTKCRSFVRTRRSHWKIASDKVEQLKPANTTAKWHKMDMWLPEAVASEFKPKELSDYGLSIGTLRTSLSAYLKDDCVNTYDLAQCMMGDIIDSYGEDSMKYLNVNNQIRHITFGMEIYGTPVHPEELDETINTCQRHIDKLEKTIEEQTGVKHVTDAKVRNILFNTYKLPVLKKTKSEDNPKESVDADTIVKLKHFCIENLYKDSSLSEPNRFLTNLLALKKYQKKHGYLTSYRNCSINGYVYPSYNIVGTDTLRVSAQNPSPQTVAKATNPFEDDFDDVSELLNESPPLRSVFGPKRRRWWISNDYSQLQLRIFAVVTGEEQMIEAFAKGWDAHDYTARRIFGLPDNVTPNKAQRRIAKNVNFGFIFGASPKKIEQTANHPGLWDTVCEIFPNAHYFIEEQKHILKSGEYVRTLGGYPLDVPLKVNKWKGTLDKAAHAAVCYIVQGSEGEIVKRAMNLTGNYLANEYPEGRIVMQVHDEINFDVPERLPKLHVRKLKSLMEQAAEEYGVVAPVNSEVIRRSWNKGIEIAV